MSAETGFLDRSQAGTELAALMQSREMDDPVVVGLPRGGVPVAAEVALALGVPLDVIVVRKLGVPSNPEFGFGAIGEDGVQVLDRQIVEQVGLGAQQIEAIAAREQVALEKRVNQIRAVHPQTPLTGKTVIIVDDGIATGIDARAACRVAHQRGAKKVILAVPIAPTDWKQRLGDEADEFIAVIESDHLSAVGQFYADFPAVEDEEMLSYLTRLR